MLTRPGHPPSRKPQASGTRSPGKGSYFPQGHTASEEEPWAPTLPSCHRLGVRGGRGLWKKSSSSSRALWGWSPARTVVNLLQGAPSAELHADPQAVIPGGTQRRWAQGRAARGCLGRAGDAASPEIAANVGHHVGVVALTQDGDLLLEGADVVPWGAQGIGGGGGAQRRRANSAPSSSKDP